MVDTERETVCQANGMENARLISAAPDLLAALELILKRGYAIEASDHQQMLDAICKARGLKAEDSCYGIGGILSKSEADKRYKVGQDLL